MDTMYKYLSSKRRILGYQAVRTKVFRYMQIILG